MIQKFERVDVGDLGKLALFIASRQNRFPLKRYEKVSNEGDCPAWSAKEFTFVSVKLLEAKENGRDDEVNIIIKIEEGTWYESEDEGHETTLFETPRFVVDKVFEALGIFPDVGQTE